MTDSFILLVILSTLSVVFLSLLLFCWRLLKLSQQNQITVQTTQLELISKVASLLASKDPLAYQAIQSVENLALTSPVIDFSDAAEAERLASLGQYDFFTEDPYDLRLDNGAPN